MKALTVLLLVPFFSVTQLSAQIVREKPLAEKTVIPVPTEQNMRMTLEPKKPTPPPPAPMNIQNAVVDIQNGDDGKDNDTRLYIKFEIRWSNIVLSQDGPTRVLLFDKNFNPL